MFLSATTALSAASSPIPALAATKVLKRPRVLQLCTLDVLDLLAMRGELRTHRLELGLLALVNAKVCCREDVVQVVDLVVAKRGEKSAH
jgi:hypothetical protein